MQIRKELIMIKSKKMIGMLLLICVAMLLPVPANAASKSQTKKLLIAKKWSNKVDDPIMAYSSKYTFQFKKNGTVVLKGWRNKDYGTYKVTGNNTTKLTFKKLYMSVPGEGWSRAGGKYTATIKLAGKKKFKAKFKGADQSNVTNGYFY